MLYILRACMIVYDMNFKFTNLMDIEKSFFFENNSDKKQWNNNYFIPIALSNKISNKNT